MAVEEPHGGRCCRSWQIQIHVLLLCARTTIQWHLGRPYFSHFACSSSSSHCGVGLRWEIRELLNFSTPFLTHFYIYFQGFHLQFLCGVCVCVCAQTLLLTTISHLTEKPNHPVTQAPPTVNMSSILNKVQTHIHERKMLLLLLLLLRPSRPHCNRP